MSFPYNEPLTPKSWDDSSDHIYAWIPWGQKVCSFAIYTLQADYRVGPATVFETKISQFVIPSGNLT